MGLVINHTLPGVEFSDLIAQMGLISDIKIEIKAPKVPVMCGGPVEAMRGFILHSSEFSQPDTIRIDARHSVTGTLEALREVAHGNGPEQALFILGYAGWDAGQLEQEIQENAWLVVDPDPEIIFHKDPEEKWLKAMHKLGIEPAQLSSEVGHA
jgi:putative transcriptional regulator